MKPTLSVGAAKLPLEYPEGFFPHKSFRGRYFTGVRDDLFVRALCIGDGKEKSLLLSVELGDISDAWLPDIAKATGIPKEHVFLTATHTHAAPHACGTWPEDVIDAKQSKAFCHMCKERVIQAAVNAQETMQPAKMRYNAGRCDINVNRDYKYTGKDGRITAPYIQAPNHGKISDKTIAVLKLEDMAGKTLAYLVNYAVHSNVTFYQTWTYEQGMLVTGDLAGIAMKQVEQRSDDGTVALFTMGAAADQMPEYLANHRVFDRDGNAEWVYYGQSEGYALADAQASSFAREVLRIAASMPEAQSEFDLQVAAAMVESMGKQDGAGKSAAMAKAKAPDTYAQQYKEQLAEEFQYAPTELLNLRLCALRLGSVVMLGVPAEIVTSIGADMKCALSSALGVQAIIMTQCNGSYSYISDESGYKEKTFEAVASHFMPGIGKKLLEGAKTIAQQLKNKES